MLKADAVATYLDGFEDVSVITYSKMVVVMDVAGFAPVEIASYDGIDEFYDCAYDDVGAYLASE